MDNTNEPTETPETETPETPSSTEPTTAPTASEPVDSEATTSESVTPEEAPEEATPEPEAASTPDPVSDPTPDTTPEPASEPLVTPLLKDTPPEASAPAPVAKKPSGKKLGKMIVLILLVLCIPLAAFGGYTESKQSSDKKVADLNSQLALINSNTHELPAGTIKVSDCVPNMGAHYLTKASDPRYGPFLLVNKQNKVIGVEYMTSKDMYTAIPNTDPPVELVEKDSPMYGWKFDHYEISHLPKGHEGLPIDHVDVHLYTVTAAQEKNACI